MNASPGPVGARALVESMRPLHWVKNGLVFAGLIFTGELFHGAAWLLVLQTFLAFCCAASAIYLWNDLRDRAADAHHPRKRLRPLASGRLDVAPAAAACALLGGAALLIASRVNGGTLGLVAGYLAAHALYGLGLKRVFLLDAMIVSAGFVLRAAAGATAVSREISSWLLLCTFLLALFLALAKRRDELRLLGAEAPEHRASLEHYSLPLLDSWLTALSGATIVCYALYTQSPRTLEIFHTTALVYTIPFVVYALFRYQYLVIRRELGGDPAALLAHDLPLKAALAGWALTAVAVVYRG